MTKSTPNPTQTPSTAQGTKADDELPIKIELSSAQVDHVVRAAAGGGSLSFLLTSLDVSPGLLETTRDLIGDTGSNLSSSLLWGLLVFAVFPLDGTPLRNADVAHMLDLSPSTAHRYIGTLIAAGVLERDPITRRYRRAVSSTVAR